MASCAGGPKGVLPYAGEIWADMSVGPSGGNLRVIVGEHGLATGASVRLSYDVKSQTERFSMTGNSSMEAYLRITSGPDAGRTINLKEGVKLTIGRGEKSDTRLTDLSMSRLHCELKWENGKFHLVDLNSVGGTMVEGSQIQECDVKHGQEIQIGGTRLKLHTTGIPDAHTLVAAQKPARELKADDGVLTGKKLSNYEIGALIAKGRTGTVYKGRDARDGKEVAVKVLHSDFTSDEEDVQRFVRAMTTVCELKHPNLVALYGAGKQGDTCWLAMEYVDGEPLTKVIERIGTLNMLEWRFALGVGVHVAQALEAAHEKHIIHRNVSPESILIRTKDKVAKLGDMMLAKALEGIKAKQITRPGELVGNIAYMASGAGRRVMSRRIPR